MGLLACIYLQLEALLNLVSVRRVERIMKRFLVKVKLT